MSGNIVVYTDGCALGNPGPGGFGAVLMYGQHRKELCEGFQLTTNNRMELLAVIRALQTIKQAGIRIDIYTDSKYVCNAITEGWLFNWKKKGWAKVKNPDLWQQLLPLYERFKPQFHWVKGHSGVPENERCDELANMGAALPKKPKDMGYEKQNTGPGLL
ncbi:MAG: ribonuclease HI [Bacteroidia bacterium]|nr:ribonuclease HI [Bacteroidia bacterium]